MKGLHPEKLKDVFNSVGGFHIGALPVQNLKTTVSFSLSIKGRQQAFGIGQRIVKAVAVVRQSPGSHPQASHRSQSQTLNQGNFIQDETILTKSQEKGGRLIGHKLPITHHIKSLFGPEKRLICRQYRQQGPGKSPVNLGEPQVVGHAAQTPQQDLLLHTQGPTLLVKSPSGPTLQAHVVSTTHRRRIVKSNRKPFIFVA